MNQYVELICKINTLKRKNINIVTNAFFTTQQLQFMIDSNKATIKISDDAVIILVEEEWLVRLYFYATAFDSLKQILNMLPPHSSKAIIADVIGKNPQAEKLACEMQKLSFCKHNELIRMNRLPKEFTEKTISNVIIATPDKGNEIMNILYNEFDVYTSHLPTKERILKSITNKEITIAIQQEKIIGLAYFETLGERLKYLYQMVVDKNFRGKGIADSLLMYTFEHSSRDTSFQLWVETNNQRAIGKYQKYNFIPNGLVDYIMLYKGE